MRRTLLRSAVARRAGATAASAPFASRRDSFALLSFAVAPRKTLSAQAASTLICAHSILRLYSWSALDMQKACYASAPPSDTNPNNDGKTKSQEAAENTSDEGPSASWRNGEETANNFHTESAVDFSQTPSLRDTLPPSAVELPETSFLKCIEKEMMDEKYRLDKEEGPPPVPVGWTMHHTEGTSFIYGRRVWVPPPSNNPSVASVDMKAKTTNTAGQNTANDSQLGEQEERQQPQKPQNAPLPRAVEKHFLRLQLTTRDASLDPECDVRGEHFPFSFFVQRVRPEGDSAAAGPSTTNGAGGAKTDLEEDAFDEHTFYHNSIEVRCDVVDGELVVDNVVYHGPPNADSSLGEGEKVDGVTRPHYANPFGGYPGPSLDETEEEVLDGIQSWLAERGVDDQLGEFVGQYAIWIEQAEYELWLQQLRDYVAA